MKTALPLARTIAVCVLPLQCDRHTCSLQGFHSHCGGNPKTGQAGGLP